MIERVEIGGRSYVTLHAVAECYHVEVRWIEEVYRLGLLGRSTRHAGQVVVATTKLDRVARVIHLHFHQGVSLEACEVLLNDDEKSE